MATKQNCIEPISKLLRLGAGALLVWAALGPAMAQGIAFRGTASAWTNNTSITISKPTGVVQGDFLMAVIRTRIGAGWNVPSGWTQLMIHTSGGTQVVFYKFAGSSEPTSYTFTATGPHRMAGGIVAYSGVHSATPIDVYNGATGNSTSMAAPSLTTTSANTMLVAFYGINNNVAFTQPASMSLRFSQQTVDSGDFDHQVRVGASDETFGGPGATGTRTATTTSPSGNTWVAQMVALNPGPLTFYSRASGSWTSASTWSTTGHTGSAAPRAPGSVAGDDVIIGNSHTVTLDASQSAVDVTINSTGTLAMGTSVLGGAATFTLNSGGALRIGSAAGITSSGTSGNVQVTGTRTFSTGATYTYNGSAAQATGDGLPTSIAGLTVNNASGVTLSQSTTVTGPLTLTSGTLTTNANTLTIGSAGSVARTSGHVVGNLQKNVAVGATTRTYEIGDASTYRPVTVTFGNVTTAGNLTATVSTSAGDHPNLATSGLDGARSVNRYWTLTNGGVVFDSYSATFTFVAGDVDVGATTSKFLVRRYSSGWSTTTTGTRTATTTQATGITGFGAFAVAEQLLNNFLVEAAGGGNIPTQTAGTPFSIRITARDALNATVTDYTSTVDVTSTGTLSSGGGTTAAFSAGVLSSHSVTITNTGSFTITATRTSGGTQSGTSNSCTVNPGALSTFLVQASGGGNIPTQTAGLPFSIRVTARDAYSNTVTGFTETVNITSTGTLSAGGGTTAAFTAGVLASHSVTISNAGTFTLTATRTSGGTQSGTSNAFVVNAAIYYSRASGNWNVAATWSTTGHTGAAATTTPGSSSADSVVVGSSHTVTLNVNASGVGVRVSSTGQLNLGTFVLSGARTFTLASGGTLGIGSTAGITSSGASGNVQVTGTRSFSTGASYLYNGSAAQATGSGLPATVNNLTVNNGAGVSLTNSVTVSGTLSLTSGALSIGARTLTLNGAITQTSGSLTGGSTSNVTVGGAGASTTLPAVTLNNLTLNRANGLSLGGSVTVGGTLTLTAGALSIGANTLTLNGTVAQASGSLTGGASSNVVVGGTGASTTLPGVTLNTLTLNRANGLSLGGSTTVGGTLTLTSGTLSIGANTLTLNGALAQTGGSLAGGSQSNLVVGGSGVALTLAAIQLGGLTLNRTAGLRMTGDLTVGGTLTLTSGVLTMASGMNLIANTKSATAGSLRFEREIAGQRGWRLLSSPAVSTYADLLGGLVTQGFPGSTFPTRSPNVLWYQEDFVGTDNQRWRQPAALTDTLTGGGGLFVYVFGSIPGDPDYNTPLPITIDVGGLEHEGPAEGFDFGVTYTAAADSGWNLIGNPYGAAIDWGNAAGWTRANVDQAIYVWDPAANGGNGEYLVSNGVTGSHDGRIAPFQGFWVKATAPNPVLRVNNAAKTTGGTFYGRPPPEDHPSLTLRLASAGLETSAFVLFAEGAWIGKDPLDAYRLVPMTETYLELYTTMLDGTPLAINTLPRRFSREVRLPLGVGGFVAGQALSGSYTLAWPELTEIPEAWTVELIDHATGTVVSLRDATAYTFDVSAAGTTGGVNTVGQAMAVRRTGGPAPRFTLRIDPGEVDPTVPLAFALEPNAPNPFRASTTIRYAIAEEGPARVEVFDLLGRLVAVLADRPHQTGYYEAVWHADDAASGLYVCRLLGGGRAFTRRMTLVR